MDCLAIASCFLLQQQCAFGRFAGAYKACEHTLTASLPLASGPERTCPLEPPIVSSLTASPLPGVQSAATSARLSAFKSNAAGPTCGADLRTCNSLSTYPAITVQSCRGFIKAKHHTKHCCRPCMPSPLQGGLVALDFTCAMIWRAASAVRLPLRNCCTALSNSACFSASLTLSSAALLETYTPVASPLRTMGCFGWRYSQAMQPIDSHAESCRHVWHVGASMQNSL